jgi:hypothetical protein
MAEQKAPVALYELLLQRFSLDELRTLCFRMGVDYDSIESDGKAGKARELVLYMIRRGQLIELRQEIEKMRPDIQMAAALDAAEASTSQPTGETTTGAPQFVTNVTDGKVDQVINVEKLEGGLHINKGK